jgi:hypothetical protein
MSPIIPDDTTIELSYKLGHEMTQNLYKNTINDTNSIAYKLSLRDKEFKLLNDIE